MIWDDHSSSKVVFIKGFFNESLPDLHDRLRADGSGLAWFGVLAKLFLGASHHQTIKLYHYAMNQKQKNTETIPNKERKTLGSFAESSQKNTKDPAHVGPAAANGLLWRSHTWISCNYVRLHHSKRSQGRIALLHLDADLYSSYLDTLLICMTCSRLGALSFVMIVVTSKKLDVQSQTSEYYMALMLCNSSPIANWLDIGRRLQKWKLIGARSLPGCIVSVSIQDSDKATEASIFYDCGLLSLRISLIWMFFGQHNWAASCKEPTTAGIAAAVPGV